MKISILLPDLRGGGVERIRLVLAGEFQRVGHEVEFVLLQARGELLGDVEAKFPIYNLDVNRLRSAPRPLYRYLRNRKPTVLLAAMWPLTGIATVTSRFASVNTRVVVSEHVDFRATPSFTKAERLFLQTFGKGIYGAAHRTVAVSEGVKDSLIEVAGVAPKRISVIHNPVREASPSVPARDIGPLTQRWQDAPTKIISVGSLKRQKRFDVLVDAFSSLREDFPEAQLLILGEGNLREELSRQISRLDLSNHVCLPGFVPDVHSFMAQADCFVLSSDWEGFGNVIVEALSMGCPVVSTDCRSGPAEILGRGEFGRLTVCGEPQSLYQAIRETLLSPPDLAHLIDRSKDFSPQSAAQKYLKAMDIG